MGTWEECVFCSWIEFLYVSDISGWIIVLFSSFLYVFVFYLVVLSIIESKILKSPIFILEVSISPFCSVKIFSIFWWSVIVNVYNCYIFILYWKFSNIQYPSTSLVTFFDLKFIFSCNVCFNLDISLTTPTLFWLLPCMQYLSPSFHF